MDNGDYASMVDIEDPTSSVSDNSRGTRTQESIVDGTWCQHVSSIYIQTIAGGGVEVGYLIGWSSCPGYTNTWYAQPTVFYYAFKNSDTGHAHPICKVFASKNPSPGSFPTFEVSDTNHDGIWDPKFNGVKLESVNLDFSSGLNVESIERGACKDSGYASYPQGEEYHDGNFWSIFDNLAENRDDDDDWDWSFPQVNFGKTVHVHTTTC